MLPRPKITQMAASTCLASCFVVESGNDHEQPLPGSKRQNLTL